MRRHIPVFMMMAAAISLIGMSGVRGSEPPAAAAEVKIAIMNYKFDPETVTVPAGTKVTWVNHDDVPHSVVSSDKRFPGSGGLDKGDDYSYVFTSPGSYEYFCSLHPFMKGKIVVTDVKPKSDSGY